jgi:hypothetical protein
MTRRLAQGREAGVARKTREELQAAQRARQAEQKAQERAEAERTESLIEARDRKEELVSVADGLYDELDKHARKWPTMPVTKRTVQRVNKLLGETRKLLEDEADDFAAGLEDIVPAGDPPETRDVVMLLREVRDALSRFEDRYAADWRAIERAEQAY